MIKYFSLIQNDLDKEKSIEFLAKGARIASRASMILRFLKSIRILRILKVAKIRKYFAEINKEELNDSSAFSRRLLELTTKRIITLLSLLIFANFLFDINFYINKDSVLGIGLKVFNKVQPINKSFNLVFNTYVDFMKNTNTPLIYANIYNITYGNIDDVSQYRIEELIELDELCNTINNTKANCYTVFDNTDAVRQQSTFNIIRIIVICFILGLCSFSFYNTVYDLVISPLEIMTKKIQYITSNPIEAIRFNEMGDSGSSATDLLQQPKGFCRLKRGPPLETALMERTITKIGGLLALGFGEAGAEIIEKNMKKGIDGEVNPMLPGKKIIAIYAFCDIRNFTDTTEILERKVMLFVNEIAEIVHGVATAHNGSPNKNVGDAFLLVWKIEESLIKFAEESGTSLGDSFQINQLADMALIAIIKILIKVQKSFVLSRVNY
jgi:hypothetical protein